MRPTALSPSFFPRPARRARLGATVVLAALLGACASGVDLDEPLENSQWRLVQLGDPGTAAPADPARQPQLQFDDQGRISGTGGCNRFSGAYTRNASQLRMTQLAATRMACPDSGATEAQFFQVLQTTASYRLAGPGGLVLLGAGGHTLARLESTAR